MVNIRKMCEQDLEQVMQIENAVFSVPWSENTFADSLHSENTLYVVAEKECGIVGYCGMYVSLDEADITNVAVDSLHRREKTAEKMLRYLIGLATEKGVTEIFLEVRETNVGAIRLYERLGFEEVGIRKNYYEKPKENALIMWKHNL
jgi:ribosomal-protein-alanine N-acetyltransferase